MENKKYANGGYSEDWYERGESTAKWFQNDREEYERAGNTMKIEKEEAQTVDVQIQEKIDLETVKDLEEKQR